MTTPEKRLTGLVRYDAARTAIAECVEIDEAKDLTDRAAALAAYARQADDPELELMARRIRARATRRMGEISRGLETASPGPVGDSSHRREVTSKTAVLAEAGISTSVANRAEKVADIPEEKFNAAVEADVPATLTDLVSSQTKPRRQTRARKKMQTTEPPDWLAVVGKAVDLLQTSEPADVVADLTDDRRASYAELGDLVVDYGLAMRKAVKDAALVDGTSIETPLVELLDGPVESPPLMSHKKGWPGPHTQTGKTWASYAEAYHKRYSAYPVWNASVGGKMAQFVKRLGQEDAPQVAAFFLARDDRWYVDKGHGLGAMLADAEKLHTAWVTGRRASPPPVSKNMAAAEEARERRWEREARAATVQSPSSATSADHSDERAAFDLYNQTAEAAGLPKAQVFNDDRKHKIKLRLRDCGGLDGWRHALEKLATSKFLTGGNPRGWCASLDFMLKESTFTKLMEDTYESANGMENQIKRVSRRLEDLACD